MVFSVYLFETVLPNLLIFHRISLDLRELSKEVTHNLWRTVEDGAGLLNVLVTISATTRGDSPSNLTNWEEDLDLKKANWIEEYVSLKISVANYLTYSVEISCFFYLTHFT